MVSKLEPKVTLSVEPSGNVSIHKWWDNAGRFMTFTREEAIEVSRLLNKEFDNEQLSRYASPHPQGGSIVPR